MKYGKTFSAAFVYWRTFFNICHIMYVCQPKCGKVLEKRSKIDNDIGGLDPKSYLVILFVFFSTIQLRHAFLVFLKFFFAALKIFQQFTLRPLI